MSDHIHVGYRGGAFGANFDSIFKPKPQRLELPSRPVYCDCRVKFRDGEDRCPACHARNPKTRSV